MFNYAVKYSCVFKVVQLIKPLWIYDFEKLLNMWSAMQFFIVQTKMYNFEKKEIFSSKVIKF